MLKEVIEQRSKLVEETVAADSVKLQNRIRELERENRELQWNARKLFNAFRQFLIANEKVRLLHLLYVQKVFAYETLPVFSYYDDLAARAKLLTTEKRAHRSLKVISSLKRLFALIFLFLISDETV